MQDTRYWWNQDRSIYISSRQQMISKKAESSASDVSGSGHSDNGNKSKAIANGAAKVFNKIGLKTRPSTAKIPAEEHSKGFQIVHTPDRSPIDMLLPDIPTTNEEFYAAISQINAQGHLYEESGSLERKGVSAGPRKGSQQSPDSTRYVIILLDSQKCSSVMVKGRNQAMMIDIGVADEGYSGMVPRTVVTSPHSTEILLGPKGNGPLEKIRKGLDTPEKTLSANAPGKVRPKYTRRVASDGVPPRPLSERPLIKYSSMRVRPSLQMQHSSMSTPNAHSVSPILSRNASGNRQGHNRINSGERNGRRRPRRVPSVDSSSASSVKTLDSDDETFGHGASSARNTRDSKQKTQDSSVDSVLAQKRDKCYFCQEDSQAGDNLCSKCQSRFQPQEEVFDYSESEYEDYVELDDSPTLSAEAEMPRGTSSRSSRSSKRRNTRPPRPREKSRGWSEFSSMSQLQQLASRSASTSPTPHVAMELKIVPPQDIKIRTVTSPTRSSAGDGRSALHHIQQALKPRAPISPSGQDRDAVRLGKVRSGEIRRVDYPDIVKAKDPSPNKQGSQGTSQEHQQQSRDSFKNWLKYHDDGDNRSEKHSGSASSTPADLPTDGQRSAVPAPSAYDRVTSIYDLYASFDDA